MNYTNTYSDLYDPAFPQSTLDIRTELLLAGAWTDISTKAYNRAGFNITRGHADEASNVQPSVAALQVNNRGGQFSPRNPSGAYYGVLGRNTPCRISLPTGTCHLRMEDDNTSYAWCPPVAPLQITGSIDVRIDVKLSDYQGRFLASMWGASWNLATTAAGQLSLEYTPDGVTTVTMLSSMPIPLGRIVLRATLDTATGNVTFYTAPAGGIDSGPYTQLGAVQAGSGATTLHASGASALRVGLFYGNAYAFELRSGIGGTVVASPSFTAQPPGTAPFADAQGNIWSMAGTAEISNRRYRHHGEVPAWPQRWDPTGQDVYVPIEPSGLLRRYTQGTPPQYSALLRAYATLTGSAAPVAYWPCEDGSNAAVLGSALPGGSPMVFSGTPSLSSNSDFICSQAIPVLAGSAWSGPVATNLAWLANVVRFLIEIPSGGDTNGAVVARFYTSGTVGRVDMVYSTSGGGSLTLNCYGLVGTLLGSTSVVGTLLADGTFGGCNGQLMRVDMDLQASGSSVIAQIQCYVLGAYGGTFTTLTFASSSLGAATSVQINPQGSLTQTAVGHVSVQRAWDSLFDLIAALNANAGEAAAVRFARLCAEQGVICRIYGFPADSVAMGYQSTSDFVSLLQECEDADRGLIYEPRQALALGYRTRASLCNQSPKVALTYTAAHLSPPVEPTDDDQNTANDVTVTRATGSITGSSARQYLASGAMSVQAPPYGIGEYATQLDLNVATDALAAQLAGWVLNVGTVDAPRYPVLTLDLARSELAALSDVILDADVGDLLTVASTPSWLPPDGVSQILRGMTETLNTFTLTEAFTGAPSAPYTVGVYDDAGSHYDTDGAAIFGSPSATAATIQVATTNPGSPLWTTVGGDFPFDITVSAMGTPGERMTVTGITGASSPQTFAVVRSVNGVVRAWPNGSDVRLYQPVLYSL